MAERGEVPEKKLTHADLFYRCVSQIEDIIGGVLKAQEEVSVGGEGRKEGYCNASGCTCKI